MKTKHSRMSNMKNILKFLFLLQKCLQGGTFVKNIIIAVLKTAAFLHYLSKFVNIKQGMETKHSKIYMKVPYLNGLIPFNS